MHQPDWYLKQCDITQYVLRKSNVFKGEIATKISGATRLIVVAQHKPTEKIYFDILAAIPLSEDNVLFLTPSQLISSADEINRVTWFIDVTPPDSWFNQARIIQTRQLSQLANDPLEKRQLWQQLCQYEHDFNLNDS